MNPVNIYYIYIYKLYLKILKKDDKNHYEINKLNKAGHEAKLFKNMQYMD